MFKFNLGDEVKCIITGFKGVIVSRTEYFNGCIAYGVKPPIDKEGKLQDNGWLDEPQLELVKENKFQSIGNKKYFGGDHLEHPKQY